MSSRTLLVGLSLATAACGLRSPVTVDGGGGGTGGGTSSCVDGVVPAASLSGLGGIRDLGFDSNGRLYVLAKLPSPRVRVLGPAPLFEQVGELGVGALTAVNDFDVGPTGAVHVVDGDVGKKRLFTLRLNGGPPSSWDAGDYALSIVELFDGGLILGNSDNEIDRYESDGGGPVPIPHPSGSIEWTNDMQRSPDGQVWHADFSIHKILLFDPDTGAISSSFGSTGSAPGQFDAMEAVVASPSHLAVDGAGRVYADDFYNHRVQWFSPGGQYQGELAVAGTTYPWALAVQPQGGRLFVGYGGTIEIRCVP